MRLLKAQLLFLVLSLQIFCHVKAQQLFNTLDIEKIISLEEGRANKKISHKTNVFTENYDQVYLRASWQIDPMVYYIRGELVYHLRPLSSDLNTLYFELSDSLQFNWFIFQGDTSYNFERPGGDLIILYLGAAMNSSIDSVTLSYEGAPPSTGFGSFNQSSHLNDSIIWTLSEPYGSSDWFPGKESLTDKLDSLDVFIRTPLKYHAGTAGILMSEAPIPGMEEKIIHWRHRYPIANYLIGVAITNYAVINENALLNSGDTVKIINYIYPEDSALYAANPPVAIPFLQLFSDLFGDYPFKKEKYGHAQFNWGGGMEHQTMSFVYRLEYFELTAHELAHQWFGDKVTCGSWQDIWLNEGFATYLSGLCYEYLAPQYWIPFKDAHQDRAFKDTIGSVFCEDTSDVGRIFSGSLSYSKGAYLLHMLRWKLGDEDFFKGVYEYINDTTLCYGFARTDDLIHHLEAVSGQQLGEFFNDWFYGKGYPTYHLKWASLPDKRVNIAIHQTQNHSSVSFFEMPVPVRLKDASHDTVVVIQNDANDLTYTIGPLSFTPDSIFFDPDLWLLAKSDTPQYDKMISQLLILYPNPASDEITIGFHGDQETVEEINIYDVTGKRMVGLNTEATSFFNPVTIDISNLSGGYYLVNLLTDKQRYVQRIVKF
jgi:hypothetical protein